MLVEVLGSFCNFVRRGQGRGVFAERRGEGGVQNGIGLNGFQLLEGTVEGSLDAGVVAGETVELVGVVLIARLGFKKANAAKVPGGGNQFIEQSLLDGALGLDVGLEAGEEVFEFLLFAGGDDDFAGGEAVFRGILRGAGFSFGSAGSGGMLRVGGVGRELSGGSGHDWSPVSMVGAWRAVGSGWLW